jgi:glycosyltransferase involved in cell wall biosynthesis
VLGPQARHPLLWKWWYDVKIPSTLKKIKADVFVSADSFCSLHTKVPQLLVIHDLAFLHHPSFIKKSHLGYYKRNTPKFLQKAERIVTVSAFSKKDILDHYPVDAGKVTVIHNGVKEIFKPVGYDQRNLLKHEYAGGREYFIYAGSIHPRKNLFQLLKAFSVFKKRLQSNMKLLIAGRLAWEYDSFVASLDSYKYKEDVKLLNYLPDEELSQVMAAAYALVYPSYFEGFGLPVVEAMRCHVPVICSRTSALPEVAGEAALFFNPGNFEELADRMMLMYKDENLRAALIQRGIEQAEQFNWDRTAQQLWNEIIATAES